MAKGKKIDALEKEIETLKQQLKSIVNEITYYQIGNQKEKIKELEERKTDILSKLFVISAVLQYPLIMRLQSLTPEKMDEMIDNTISEINERLDAAKQELNNLKNPIIEVEIPENFSELSEQEQLSIYNKNEEEKSSKKLENDNLIKEKENDIAADEDLMSYISSLRGSKSRNACIFYLKKLGLKQLDQSLNIDELFPLFESLKMLPNGLSLNLSKYLISNPEKARKLIEEYRTIKFEENVEPYQTNFYLNDTNEILLSNDIDFASTDPNLRLQKFLEYVGLNNERQSCSELLSKSKNGQIYLQKIEAIYQRKKSQLQEFHEFVNNISINRSIPKFNRNRALIPGTEDNEAFYNMLDLIESGLAFYSDNISVKFQSSDLVKALKDFTKNETPYSKNDIIDKFVELQVKYAKKSQRNVFVSKDKRKKEMFLVEEEMKKLNSLLENIYRFVQYYINQDIIFPRIENLGIPPIDSRYPSFFFQVGMSERGIEPYNEYCKSLELQFSRIKGTVDFAYSSNFEKAKEVYEQRIGPAEDSIFEIIKSAIGIENKEQAIEIGRKTIEGIFSQPVINANKKYEDEGTIDVITDTGIVKQHRPVDKLTDEDVQLAQRRAVLAAYASGDDELARQIKAYLNGEVNPEPIDPSSLGEQGIGHGSK